ncbi:MAG: glycolate oxidase subunit GlcE [Alphaproteobacteria bacterium]|nr:glycolate oxidase subunit GlcE [Alphaproteobacteria bacterium]
MAQGLRPRDEGELQAALAWALAEGQPLALRGQGSKLGFGRPVAAGQVLDLSGLAGIVVYEPEELVLTAGPGTPLSEIEGLLSQHRQQLAFEPADYGAISGGPAGRQTLGGVIACNISGPRRVKAGAARDHLLGFKAVSGRAEAFKSGGRVVKNVTGYDLSKLMAGSHGTLAALSEVTLKVLPAPEATATVLLLGQDDRAAIAALAQAAGSPHEVSGLAHLPAAAAARSQAAQGRAMTAVRLEGPTPSVRHRADELVKLLARQGATLLLDAQASFGFWQEVRDVQSLLPADRQLWRLSLAPGAGPAVVAELARRLPALDYYYDWAGGLVWLALPPTEDAWHPAVRGAVASAGHATLLRAEAGVRAAVPVFQPQPPALAALSQRVKASFDPKGLLNPGRMHPGP